MRSRRSTSARTMALLPHDVKYEAFSTVGAFSKSLLMVYRVNLL